jgi:AAA15 family ATPase/GTPase
MLSSFYIKNFRSILELNLDFSFGEKKAPANYREGEILPFLDGEKRRRMVPCAAFFGANASGKSNIIKALAAFKRLLRSDGNILTSLFEPNLLNAKYADTTFGVVIILEGNSFEYKITYNANEIIEELLKKNGEVLYSIRKLVSEFSSKIISGVYTQERLNDILRVECSKGEGLQTKPFLNRIGVNYSGLNEDLKNFFEYLRKIYVNPNEDALPFPMAVRILSNSIFGGDEDRALNEITNVVRHFDIDISSIGISKRSLPPDGRIPSGLLLDHSETNEIRAVYVTTVHTNISGKETLLDFMKHESAGTQRLAGLIGLILSVIKTGGVLVVDELECSLHPLLMREIVLMFKKRRCNPNNAQLIFTTHNVDILDNSILRLSEVSLVSKTINRGTMVRRLVDVKKDGEDIRNVTNFRKQYLAGFYASIPYPAL